MQEQASSQIIVEIVSEEPELADAEDVALVGEVRTALSGQLEEDGFSLSLGETHQKGGDVWLLVGMEAAKLAQAAWNHHHEIVETIDDAGTLYLFCTQAVHIAARVHQAFKKRARPGDLADKTCTITIEVDGVSMTLEPKLLEQPDAALQLVRRFAQLAPEIAQQVKGQSKVRLQGKLPKHPRKKRQGYR